MPTVASIRQMDVPAAAVCTDTRRRRAAATRINIMARLKPGDDRAGQGGRPTAGNSRKDKRDRTFTIDVVPPAESVVERATRLARRVGLRRSCC
jgi:hypothetical protein